MADNLPSDLVILYQDAFAHFDNDNDGIIFTKYLGPLLKYCGENPSEAEIQVLQLSRYLHRYFLKLLLFFFTKTSFF